MATLTSNIELEEGSDLVKMFLYKNPATGLPKDTTGCTVEIQIKFEYLTTPAIYRSDVSPYILLGGSNGTIEVNIPWLTIFNEDLGKGSYNLFITTPQNVTSMHSKGFLTIVRSGYPITPPGELPGSGGGNGGGFTKGPALMEQSLSVVVATDHPPIPVKTANVGLGTLSLIPIGTGDFQAIGSMPDGAIGVRMYLAEADSVTFAISNAGLISSPETFTIEGGITGPNWDENLADDQMIYIQYTSGTPKFRWI